MIAPWFAGADARAPEKAINRARALAAKKPVALVFFATWCEPCRVGLGLLRAEAARLAARGVQVILVDYREGPDEVSAFLDAERLRFPTMLDKFGGVARDYGVATEDKTSLPKTFVIGGDGRVRAIFDTEGPDFVERLLEAAAAP